jgi:hypothetical protein
VKAVLLATLLGAASATTADPTEAICNALARGMAAEASGDAKGLLASAHQLDAAGARPVAGEVDMAGRWRTLAEARGIKDEAVPYRGRALGPAYRRGRLDPGAALATDQLFLAGQKAVVSLVPEPGRKLSMQVAEPERSICEVAAQAPRAACAWLPLFTTRVKIRVVNRSLAPATYYLVSN